MNPAQAIGLCGNQCHGRTWPFIKTCIRPDAHAGACKGIEDGMTVEEALALSEASDDGTVASA